MNPGLGLRILYVEDDEELQEVFAELLNDQGYEVTVASSSGEGLRRLQEQQFDLVISDYALPDKTGGWMLRQAESAGLLQGAESMIITAHPSPTEAAGLRILRKPLDIDYFLTEIEKILVPARQRLVEKAKRRLDGTSERGHSPGALRIELALYISASSPSSLKALRNLEQLLLDYEAAQVSFVVYDLSKEMASTVEEDRIAFTPTLVKRFPQPKTWIVGDLEDGRLVTDLLIHAGAERRQ